MKQTAVEWLEKRFYFTKGQLIDIDFEQALAMEKEQIIDAYNKGLRIEINGLTNKMAEQYYNETYGKQ
jgi:hypothetical protein